MQSDAVAEGIYFFGGRNEKGEVQNKLRYFKPVVIDGKIVHGEFTPLKGQGAPPAARYGHTMSHLPCNNSLMICGGRNDTLCAQNMTPFLDDCVLFLLDQKVWLNVKYTVASDRIDHMGNHCVSVITDHEQFEKIVVFGGITNKVGETMADLTSSISN